MRAGAGSEEQQVFAFFFVFFFSVERRGMRVQGEGSLSAGFRGIFFRAGREGALVK